jgi:hypothetical protein
MMIILLARPWISEHAETKIEHVNILTLDEKSPFHDKVFDALMLRVRLEAVGASPEEIKAFLAAPRPEATANETGGFVEKPGDQIDEFLKARGNNPAGSGEHALPHPLVPL